MTKWLGIVASVISATVTTLASTPAWADLQVHFIDVGQGDAIFLRTDEASILIDGGNDDGLAMDYLAALGVAHIDLVIGTHAHADHIGGLAKIVSNYPVGTIWYNGQTHTTLTFERFLDAVIEAVDGDVAGTRYHEPVRGETFALGDLTLTVLNPATSLADAEGDLNNGSIAVKASYGSTSFLFTGDIEADAEYEILASGLDISADVLGLAHHGSSTSTTEAFLAAVNPSIAVYQAGDGNSYGHPHREVVDRLHHRGIEVLGTDLSGTVALSSSGSSIVVYTEVDR